MGNIFEKIFGRSNNMKVLDYLLDLEIDVTIIDICEGTELSRKTVEKILGHFVKENIIEITRKIGKTEMYKLNLHNPISKKLIEMNDVVLKEQENKVKRLAY